MFRPDPNGGRSVDEIIAELGEALADLPPDSPRAQTLGTMIRQLRDMGNGDTPDRQLRLVAGRRPIVSPAGSRTGLTPRKLLQNK
jgi:hypothetical protein